MKKKDFLLKDNILNEKKPLWLRLYRDADPKHALKRTLLSEFNTMVAAFILFLIGRRIDLLTKSEDAWGIFILIVRLIIWFHAGFLFIFAESFHERAGKKKEKFVTSVRVFKKEISLITVSKILTGIMVIFSLFVIK